MLFFSSLRVNTMDTSPTAASLLFSTVSTLAPFLYIGAYITNMGPSAKLEYGFKTFVMVGFPVSMAKSKESFLVGSARTSLPKDPLYGPNGSIYFMTTYSGLSPAGFIVKSG